MKYLAVSSSFATILILAFSFVYDQTQLDFLHRMTTVTTNFTSTFKPVFYTPNDQTHFDFLHCMSTTTSNPSSTSKPIVYTPNDPSYHITLNAAIQNPRFSSPSSPKPFAILKPVHASQVQAAVYCAKKHGMQIRVRSGGHDYEGLSYVCNSNVPFVVIDMINLNSVSVDVESKSAWVHTGATLGELYYRIAERSKNLGFPAGACHSVGVGGHISGGGYGFLSRKHGLAADNIIDAKFVDAQGRILDRKSMGEDLFWAIRGGGAASFGIVIAWKLRLVDVPSVVTVFDVKRSWEHGATKKLVYWWQSRADKVDEDLNIFLSFRTARSIDNLGNEKVVLEASFQATFHGGVDRLLQVMEKEFPELSLQRQECIEMGWVESFVYHNEFRNGESLDVLLTRKANFHIGSFKAKSDYVEEPIPEYALEGMLGMLFEEDVGRGWIALYPNGGKMNEISESSIPFPHRAGNLYNIRYYVDWDDEAGNIKASEMHMSWVRKLYDYMTPYVSKNPRATYFNFRDLDIGMDNKEGYNTTSTYNNIAQASIWGTKYFKNNFDRLVRVKTSVDPTNFFSDEQSIPPLMVID